MWEVRALAERFVKGILELFESGGLSHQLVVKEKVT